jgi:hypothetical protein
MKSQPLFGNTTNCISFEAMLLKFTENPLQLHYYLQHGFRKGISTENATFRPTDSVFTSINQKMHVGGIFCDLAKAFDCVNHEILLAALRFYGIRGVTEDWFKSYLTNRRQKVEIKSRNATQNVFSDLGTLKHGAPQGSILGPLLFTIHINDLPRNINSISKPILFRV